MSFDAHLLSASNIKIGSTLADVADVTARKSFSLVRKLLPLQFAEVFGVPSENGSPRLTVRQQKLDAEVYSAEHGWIDVLLTICRTDQEHIGCRLETIYFAKQSG